MQNPTTSFGYDFFNCKDNTFGDIADYHLKEYEEGNVKKYLHCNWGKEEACNGYFLFGYTVNDRELVYTDDRRKITRTEYYNFKVCTFTRFDIPPSAPEVFGIPKDGPLLVNKDYVFSASNCMDEGVLEYEWLVEGWKDGGFHYELGPVEDVFSDGNEIIGRLVDTRNTRVKLRFITPPRSKYPFYQDEFFTACVRVRARNKYGWSDYTECNLCLAFHK